jgi:hypothetical protein
VGTASPKAWVAWSTSAQVAPPSTRTVWALTAYVRSNPTPGLTAANRAGKRNSGAMISPPVLCRELHLYGAPLDIVVALRFRMEKSPPCAPSLVVLCRIL